MLSEFCLSGPQGIRPGLGPGHMATAQPCKAVHNVDSLQCPKKICDMVPSEHDFVLGPGDDLESMIWVLTYAIMLHHQESVQASDKSGYKCNAVDQFYGGLSHSALAKERDVMVFRGINPLADKPDGFPIRHNANGLGVR